MSNGIFKLGWSDLGKGLVVAVLTAVLLYLQNSMATSTFSFGTLNWALVWQVAATSGVGYLVKNLFTSSQGNIAGIGDVS